MLTSSLLTSSLLFTLLASQGMMCALFPLHVLWACLILVVMCCAGFVNFRIETDPQRLWVGRVG